MKEGGTRKNMNVNCVEEILLGYLYFASMIVSIFLASAQFDGSVHSDEHFQC